MRRRTAQQFGVVQRRGSLVGYRGARTSSLCCLWPDDVDNNWGLGSHAVSVAWSCEQTFHRELCVAARVCQLILNDRRLSLMAGPYSHRLSAIRVQQSRMSLAEAIHQLRGHEALTEARAMRGDRPKAWPEIKFCLVGDQAARLRIQLALRSEWLARGDRVAIAAKRTYANSWVETLIRSPSQKVLMPYSYCDLKTRPYAGVQAL